MATNKPARKPNKVSQQNQDVEVQVSQKWSGPIPSPDALQYYEQVLTGSAERILVMAEKEQAHRYEHDSEVRALAKKELAQNGNAVLRAQLLGFLGILCCLGFAFASAYLNFPVVVTVLFLSVPAVSVIKEIISVARNQTK
ncbi:MAG: DUF2335 domain-containing protein [Neisseriaceae bacterium]|nr:DUF2335 domain-containing protein [Neisseriaceae bacterium]